MLKKLIAITIMTALVVPGLSGCVGQKNKVAEGNEVSVEVFDNGSISSSEGNMANNRWTKWINEQSGVNVTWVPVDRNTNQQKMNAMLAAGSAPDLIIEFDRSYIAALTNQGVLATVDDCINKYSTVYKDYYEKNPELKPYTNFNGKTYAFTSKRPTDFIANEGMWIRQDWLDKLGLKAPTTDEELFNVAKAFTEQDPDGNGKNDTFGIAMDQWEEAIPSFFFANAIWYNENGAAKFGSTVERYKDYLAFQSKLYQSKVIDPEFFTDKTRKSQEQLWKSGRAGILLNDWTSSLNRDLLTNVPTAKAVPLEPVSTKYGHNGMWQEVLPYMYVVMNKDAKNPKAAVKFLDWMLDNGWFTLKNGFENVNYRMNNNVPQIIDMEKNTKELGYAGEYALLMQAVCQPQMYQFQAAPDMLSQELAKEHSLGLQTAMQNKFRRDFPYDPTVSDVTNLISEFWPRRDEIRINVIIGKVSVDDGYKQIVNAWNSMGGQNAEEKALEFYKNAGLMK